MLQTSSVQEFTDIFKQIKLNTTIAEQMPWAQNTNKTYTVEDLLKLAETSYTALSSGNKWTGVKTKGKSSVFAASNQHTAKGGSGKGKECLCFNCGEKGHQVNDCEKLKNEQCIAAVKKKFQEAKKKSHGGTASGGSGGGNTQPAAEGGSKSKGRQPESGEENKRVIDGKHMWYNKGTKRWVLDRFHPTNRSAQEGANVAQGATGAGGNAPQPTANSATNTNQDDAKSAAMANFTPTMETALSGLLNNFNN